MKYYRVLENCDGIFTGKVSLIAGELFTEKEMARLHVRKIWCDLVKMSKHDTYKMFGIRYALGVN